MTFAESLPLAMIAPQPHAGTVTPGQDREAIMLDFVNPAGGYAHAPWVDASKPRVELPTRYGAAALGVLNNGAVLERLGRRANASNVMV
jgi:hypothetical protein